MVLSAGDAAGVRVLDDRDARAVAGQLGHQLVGGVRVVQVVVAERLTLDLGRAEHARPLAAVRVRGGPLVRVLAVAQGLAQGAGQAGAAGRLVRPPWRTTSRWPGRTAPCGRRRCPPGRRRNASVVPPCRDGVQHARVVLRVRHDRDVGVVLRRRPDHGGAADVDVLDDGRVVRAGRQRRLEGVEVDHQQVDRRDAVLVHRSRMLGLVPVGQQAAVHARMQGLHAPVHDLREPGQVRHVADVQAPLAQKPRRAAGGDELHAVLGQLAREVRDPRLV